MSQLNINMTATFEKMLKEFMKIRGIKIKSEAIRTAIKECLELACRNTSATDFTNWLGQGNKAPLNQKSRFKSHDELWEK